MDVCMGFLEVDLEEEIYMHLPQGYYCLLQNGSRYTDPRLTQTLWKMVLHFRKSLYGLKLSSYVWYGTVKDFMISIGFVASRVDGGLLVLEDQDTVVATGVLDFDDLLIIANEGLIGQIKVQMKKMFRMQDLGSFSFYLGMNIECNQEPSKIDFDLYRYIGMILAKFRMHESRPVATRRGMKLVWRTPNKEA
jgi:hypothetical protein